jgi:Mn-dependent DtxR family transcriptional regulator
MALTDSGGEAYKNFIKKNRLLETLYKIYGQHSV